MHRFIDVVLEKTIMRRLTMIFRYACCLLTAGLMAGTAAATRVEGSLTYDELPVTTTFSSFTCGHATAWEVGSGVWVEGSVDLAAGTYAINDLTEGTWSISVLLSTVECSNRVMARSGEFKAWKTIELGGETMVGLDLTGYLAYHVTAPLDSLDRWPGMMNGCPQGAPAPQQFTFTWDPVPRVHHYTLSVWRNSCDEVLKVDEISVDGTSAQIELGTVPGEQFITLLLVGRAENNYELTTAPMIDYLNGSANQPKFYLDQDNPGERRPHPGNSLFVPQVAHVAGSGSTFWSSDLILSNPGGSSRVVQLVFTPRDANGLVEYETVSVEIPSGGSRVLDDVLANTMGVNGAGSLEVSPASLEVTSRISTLAPGGGSYGQGFPAIGPGDVAYVGGSTAMLGTGGVVKGSFRSNLALVETWGESAQVTVRLFDRDGSEIGSKTVDLPPFGNTQINDVVGKLGGPSTLEEGQVTVAVNSGNGRVGAVLSVVDNVSQDPTTFQLVPR
jgi:hypothetical protein